MKTATPSGQATAGTGSAAEQEELFGPSCTDPYVCWANTIEGISSGTLFRVRGICGNSKSFAQCLYEISDKDVLEIGHLVFRQEKSARSFAEHVLRAREHSPEEEMLQLKTAGVRTVCYDDAWYPARLRNIYDAPYVLYYYGDLPANERRSLAIIGSRSATPYGREQARIFARCLAANGVQIVSGMARGIDGIAGRAALDVYGSSFAVLAGGPDYCYPPENQPLYNDLKNHGGIISEYHPGIPPRANFFPARNRLISALADAVLVVEAKAQSGTMITVDRALEQGKDVFALPGRLCDQTSKGCNTLLRQGAGLATCPEDLLEYFFGAGQDEDLAIVQTRDLRDQRASLIEQRQRAAFLENSGRGPGYLHQMRLDEIPASGEAASTAAGPWGMQAEDKPPAASPLQPHAAQSAANETASGEHRWKTDIRFNDEEKARTRRQEAMKSLPPLEKEIVGCLDSTTPQNLEDILPAVRPKMKRSVAYSELVAAMTRLAVRDLVKEVRVGYYILS